MTETIKTKTRSLTIVDVVILSIGWLIILFVSSYDVYWSVRLADTLPKEELNPQGIWLMKIGGVSFFMAMKFLGTTAVLAVIPFFCIYKQWWGYSIMLSLVALQSWLFYMLTFAT